MKGLKLFLTAGVFTVLGLTGVNAADSTKVTTVDELNNCINASGTCVLQNDLTTNTTISGENIKTTIDLNGKVLTGNVVVSEKAELIVKDSLENGKITATKGSTVTVKSDAKFTFESGIINSDKGNGVAVVTATYVMNGGKITAQEFGIVYHQKANATINKGYIETRDNVAVGDNGTKGWGGSVVNINGGTLVSNIQTSGYISCGIYNANDTTLNVKSGVKITANGGGAGIVIRGGKVTIAKDVIDNMVTGDNKGKVGDSKVIVAGKVVKDFDSKYPAMDTINVNIDYAAVVDKDAAVASSVNAKQQTALGNELNYLINENVIASLANVDLTKVTIESVIGDATETDTKKVTTEAKDLIKDFKVGQALDLSVLVKNDGKEVTDLKITSNKIPFGIDVKSIVTDKKSDYEFQVIRYHVAENGTGKAEVLDSTYDAKNGMLTFTTDKFSTYLVTYKTTAKAENPQTGDGITYTVLGLLLSAFAVVGISYKLKNN